MTKEVLVSIDSIQQMEDASESGTISTSESGSYFFKNGKHYVIYDEENADIGGIVKSTLKFDENELSITKTGAVRTLMVLKKNLKNASGYNTPFGIILVETDTKEISITEEEDEINISASYELYVNEEYTSNNKIIVKIKSLG